MSDSPIGKRRGPPAKPFLAGHDPRRSPGGKPSLRKDLEAAGLLHPGLPTTPAEARARWWAAVLPVALAGPQGPKDSNWTYAHSEVGNRLLGKAKDHVVIEQGDAEQAVDWSRIPAEERRDLVTAIQKLELLTADVPGGDDGVEH